MNNIKIKAQEKKGVPGRASLSFMAIDPFIEQHIISPAEKKVNGKDMIEWGNRNQYPEYLLDLYETTTTLRTIIDGTVDFIAGDEASVLPFGGNAPGTVNLKKEAVQDQIRDISRDAVLYGGFAFQVIRDYNGTPCEIYHIPLRFLRTNEDCNVFYYSEKWHKSGSHDVTIYPAFIPSLEWGKLSEEERDRHASSIVYVRLSHTRVYPSPSYAAAVKACEIERSIDDFHLNSLDNQFVSSAIINFNNGIPTDREKEEIEATFNEKFSGKQNAGRIAFSWNKTKDTATDIVEFKVEDFGERYKALSTFSRQQIFAAFRAIPLLFGLSSEANTGFSTDEFEQSFKLYNRTKVRPIQTAIIGAYERILGRSGMVTITPFSLASETEKTVI